MGIADIQNLKNQQRLFIKKQILSLALAEKAACSESVMQHLKNIFKFLTGSWGVFDSLPTEPQIDWASVNPNVDWCYVAVANDRYQKHLVFINHKTNQVQPVQTLDGICIPALGFNTNGARLGRGGGFYDQALKNYNNIMIGVAFDFSVNDEILFESHDIKMNKIVTDQRIIEIAA